MFKVIFPEKGLDLVDCLVGESSRKGILIDFAIALQNGCTVGSYSYDWERTADAVGNTVVDAGGSTVVDIVGGTVVAGGSYYGTPVVST